MNLITTESSPGTRGLPRLTTTVPKEYVHRAGLAEVFLTSCTARGPLTYTLTGQWPRAHPYFTTPDGRAHDPLQVAETLRQAGMLLAHTELDVPLGHHFILWSLSYTTTHPHGLHIGPTPTDFTIHAHCTHLTQRRHTINRATLHMTIHRNNTPIAHGTATFSTTNPTTYTRLRGTTHTGAAATTASTNGGAAGMGGTASTGDTGGMAGTAGTNGAGTGTPAGVGAAGTAGTLGTTTANGTAGADSTGGTGGTTTKATGAGGITGTGGTTGMAGTDGITGTSGTTGMAGTADTNTRTPAGIRHRAPMPPATVNRLTPNDVVLTPTDHPHHWLLTPNLNHPTLFDHNGDHIPGMVLLEAARQATYNATHTPTTTPTHTPTTTTTTFHRYTELDQPCHIHITRITPDNNTTTTIEITGTQNNQTTFTTTTTTTTTTP
ncbi:AfsA-related hotdog domain-containing protein [Streptomyces sp. NPDC059371]|uniref:AfsA-related hotdog domain-containing protein n=1 Tax=Streptomyces sp. NPDC059371 TaxID=3346812 RepID=UPI0036790107